MEPISFFSLENQHRSIHQELIEVFNRALRKNRFILGDELEAFEREFAQYCGTGYAVGVSSGTEALHLALRACGVGKGDQVITVPNSYIATALSISYVGATPVFVDIHKDSYNIDCDALEEIIKKGKIRPKAIIPVHLYGNMADMSRIVEIGKKYAVKIIEDACQAHGAGYKGKKAGSFGHAGCFSFYPTKNLGCLGDGGIVTTDDVYIYRELQLLRNYGQEKKYYHEIKGFNSRLDEIQAAILRVKLKWLDHWNRLRREKAKRYNALIGEIEQIERPSENPYGEHIYHAYVIRVKNRDRLKEYLKERRISTMIHYPVPIHMQKAYKDLGYSKGSFKVTEKCASEILSLPLYPEIPFHHIERVCESIHSFIQKTI